jgi:hypothetical protein
MTNEFYTDLLKAQTQIEEIAKDGKNPFFNSDYATLNATILACKKILNDNNFVILQPLQSDSDGVYVCTTLIHISGEKIESRMRIKAKSDNNPQDQGSAITYARRYSLQSLLLMSAVDDDGERATDHSKKVMNTQPKIEISQDKCEFCGTTNQYHSPNCPDNPKNVEVVKNSAGESHGTMPQ